MAAPVHVTPGVFRPGVSGPAKVPTFHGSFVLRVGLPTPPVPPETPFGNFDGRCKLQGRFSPPVPYAFPHQTDDHVFAIFTSDCRD